MAIKLTTTDINTKKVSDLITNVNDHVDVSREMTGRWTGSTGTDSLIQNADTSPNSAAGVLSAIFGQANSIASTGVQSFIGGGSSHTLGGRCSAIIGGSTNSVGTYLSNLGMNAVVAGQSNTITSGYCSTILGGFQNINRNTNSAIIGGDNNTIQYFNGSFSSNNVIIGGESNVIPYGIGYCTILGGLSITARATGSVYTPELTFQRGRGISFQTVGVTEVPAQTTHLRFGQAHMASGTVTISSTAVQADSLFFYNYRLVTGGTAGILYVSAVNAGTSFVIASTDATTDAQISWTIVNPEP